MQSLNNYFLFIIFIFANSACPSENNLTAFEINKKLGRGINLGNALEAPKEGQWGVVLEEKYFKLIKDAGFDSIRIPVRWSSHALNSKPYTIDSVFFERVEWAVKEALFNDLYVIINMHHYEEIYDNPDENKERFLSMWEQISEYFKNCPKTVLFELLNEPCKSLNDEKWNVIIEDTLKIIRKSNPGRIILIGPTNWNNIDKINNLVIPHDDRNIIVTCHYYLPFHFTHQGASWAGEQSENWLGTKWTGSKEERNAVEKDFDRAFEWAKKNNRPVNIGEFGAYSKADMQSRVLWTSFISREAEKRNFSWAYWEFCSGFGIYDKDNEKWRQELVKALIPDTKVTGN